jgi:hypothetical protein
MPTVSDLDRAVFAAPLFQSGALAQLFRNAGLAYGSARRSFQEAVTIAARSVDHPLARSRFWADRENFKYLWLDFRDRFSSGNAPV